MTPRVNELVEKQEWLEPTAEKLQQVVSAAFNWGRPGKKLKNFLNGTWLGHPLHPALTDIPLGAWTAALVLDACRGGRRREQKGIDRAADTAIAVGLIGAAGAAITGLTDWQDIDGRSRRVGLVHGLLNTTGALLFTTSLILRRRRQRTAGRIFSCAGYAVALGAAYLGGNLVYGDQIGVDHTKGQTPPEHFVSVLADGELEAEEPKRVMANGMPVLLVRHQGRIHALAETCSHLGGPLSEGELEDGSIRCPWHGSCFALEDGRVLEGPATHPQPCLETRVHNGNIEVRAAR